MFPLLNRTLSPETCLGSVHSLDLLQSSLYRPQSSKTDSETIMQGTAKAALQAVGYNGPIATVDTMSKHPFRGFAVSLGPQSDPIGHVAGERSATLVEI